LALEALVEGLEDLTHAADTQEAFDAEAICHELADSDSWGGRWLARTGKRKPRAMSTA
jgi:hypothetical protein